VTRSGTAANWGTAHNSTKPQVNWFRICFSEVARKWLHRQEKAAQTRGGGEESSGGKPPFEPEKG